MRTGEAGVRIFLLPAQQNIRERSKERKNSCSRALRRLRIERRIWITTRSGIAKAGARSLCPSDPKGKATGTALRGRMTIPSSIAPPKYNNQTQPGAGEQRGKEIGVAGATPALLNLVTSSEGPADSDNKIAKTKTIRYRRGDGKSRRQSPD